MNRLPENYAGKIVILITQMNKTFTFLCNKKLHS